MKIEFTEDEISTLLVALHDARHTAVSKSSSADDVYMHEYVKMSRLAKKIEDRQDT